MKAKTFHYALLFTLAFLLNGTFSSVSAQPPLRMKANKVLHKTAAVLHAAHHQLKMNRYFTGNFAKAVAHQRYARRMYLLGDYRRAIHHSRRARMLAFTVLTDNKGTPKKEWQLSPDENMAAGKSIPSDAELDNELTKENPHQTFSDEELMDKALDDIDVEEITDNK